MHLLRSPSNFGTTTFVTSYRFCLSCYYFEITIILGLFEIVLQKTMHGKLGQQTNDLNITDHEMRQHFRCYLKFLGTWEMTHSQTVSYSSYHRQHLVSIFIWANSQSQICYPWNPVSWHSHLPFRKIKLSEVYNELNNWPES